MHAFAQFLLDQKDASDKSRVALVLKTRLEPMPHDVSRTYWTLKFKSNSKIDFNETVKLPKTLADFKNERKIFGCDLSLKDTVYYLVGARKLSEDLYANLLDVCTNLSLFRGEP